ncbi:hypothetical protein GOV09_06500 [Candidatus Woesearchaeota archaeon]|nr:hypothetical protein [Candidatus Woesearchaeota archaeon]
MIAKKEWFKPRILGWGLYPKMWEGWAYIFIAVFLFIGALNLPVQDETKTLIAGIILAVFIFDTLIVMVQVYRNLTPEEKKKQYIMEATASYVGVTALVIALLYRILVEKQIDYLLIAVLVAMALAKGATAYSKSNKN